MSFESFNGLLEASAFTLYDQTTLPLSPITLITLERLLVLIVTKAIIYYIVL